MAQLDHQLLMALMDSTPDRIYFKDRDGHFLRINRAMREYFQLSDDSGILGKTDFDLFLPEHAQDAFADEQQVLATGLPMVANWNGKTCPMAASRGPPPPRSLCGTKRETSLALAAFPAM
jgi:PAS domain-containing protein